MVERSKCMNVPEIRFKEFDEEWSENLLEDFFTKVTSKNRKLKYSAVLTNSAEYGIIGQLDYFDFVITKVRIKSDKQKNVAKLLADRRFRKMA